MVAFFFSDVFSRMPLMNGLIGPSPHLPHSSLPPGSGLGPLSAMAQPPYADARYLRSFTSCWSWSHSCYVNVSPLFMILVYITLVAIFAKNHQHFRYFVRIGFNELVSGHSIETVILCLWSRVVYYFPGIKTQPLIQWPVTLTARGPHQRPLWKGKVTHCQTPREARSSGRRRRPWGRWRQWHQFSTQTLTSPAWRRSSLVSVGCVAALCIPALPHV